MTPWFLISAQSGNTELVTVVAPRLSAPDVNGDTYKKEKLQNKL